jgi:hypothetical protein
MATESSDPRIAFILKVGVLAIGTLVVTHLSLVAYFDDMARAETYRKVGSLKPDALMSLRTDEKQRLNAGPMPIDHAMQQLAAKGRMGASPDIVPSASRDVAPLQGWTKLPSEVPPPMMAASSASASVSAAPSASASTAAPVPSPTPSGKPRQP